MEIINRSRLVFSRPVLGLAASVAWTIVLAGCGGGDGGPSTSPTATTTATPTATTTATASATATTTATPNLTAGPTLVPAPTGTPSPIAPLQFRGFYTSTAAQAGTPSPPLSFRITAQGQVTGQVAVAGASGASFVILVRGTINVAASQANDPNATAYLDLSGSGASGGQVLTYRFTGTVARNASAIVSGSGTAQTQLGDQSSAQTLQIVRQSN